MVPWNSTPVGFAFVWQGKLVEMNNPNKYWIELLVSRSNFFKTKKYYYIPEICKKSKATAFRLYQKHNRWIHFRRLFLCVAETQAIFLLFHIFLWCSFTNNAWSHGINEKNQNNSGAKAGVANGTSKNVGLGKFWQDLEISKAFFVSLEVSFFHGLLLLFLSLETFHQRVSGSDF